VWNHNHDVVLYYEHCETLRVIRHYHCIDLDNVSNKFGNNSEVSPTVDQWHLH